MRYLRIAVIAALLPFLFWLSQAVMQERGEEPLPGRLVALGVLTLLFLVRALVTEYSRGPASNLQKDVLWGVALGGTATIVTQLIL